MSRADTKIVLALLLVAAVSTSQRAEALERSDTMSEWRQSLNSDRSHLLDELRAKNRTLGQADRTRVMECMDAAASIAGHQELRIGDVAEACSEQTSAPGGSASTRI